MQNRKSSEECVGKRILCKNISHLPGHNSYIRVVMVMIIVLMVRSDSGCSLAPRRTPFYWPHSRVTPLRCCIVYVHCRVALDINCKTYIFLYFVIDFGSLTLSTEHFGRSAFNGFHCPSDDDDVGVVEVVVFELVTF